MKYPFYIFNVLFSSETTEKITKLGLRDDVDYEDYDIKEIPINISRIISYDTDREYITLIFESMEMIIKCDIKEFEYKLKEYYN